MPIGEDIRAVIEELGTSITVYKYPGPTTAVEKCDQEFYATHSSEFLRQFFSGATLVDITTIVSGDVVSIKNIFFLCASIFPNFFEDSVVDNTAVLYRCNTLGKLARYQQSATRDANYVKNRNWVDVYEDVHALQYENQFDQEHKIEENIVAVTVAGHLLFLPSHVQAKEGDRWFPDQTDESVYYRISAFDKKRLDNITIAFLNDDTRE